VRRSLAAGFPVFCVMVLGAVFAAAQVSGPVEQVAAPSPVRHGLLALDEDLQVLAEHVGPAVVTIEVSGLTTVQDPNTRQTTYIAQEQGVGSGIVVDPAGYILTNAHVVEHATSVSVLVFRHRNRLPGGREDAQRFVARIVGRDTLTDIALLKVEATDLPALQLADSDQVHVGQLALAFGSPLGLENTVTMGVVSATQRQLNTSTPVVYLQTDAAINPGNSGGPLVNAHGELVGINTFIISSNGSFAGAGFAIPSQIVRATAEQIIQHGKVEHGYLGIGMNDVTPDNAHFFNLQDASGAIVSQVTPDSPASRGGLRTGDVISEINGNKVLNGGALQVTVSEMTPGTKIALGVIRDGKPITLNLTVGQFHGNSEEASSDDGQDSLHSGKLGLAVTDLTPEVRQQANVPDQVHGVLVQNVRPGSPADEAGIQPGDIIAEVNRKPAESASQFANEVHQNPAGKELLLLVWSRGNASYRTIHTDQDGQNG